MTRRARVLSYGSSGLLVIAGTAVAILASSTLGQVLAIVLISSGLVLATALIFYEVGLSEDRERAREQARQKPKPTPGTPRPRRRLDRMRGRTRRLR